MRRKTIKGMSRNKKNKTKNMRIKKEIGIKINRERLEALYALYDWLISVYETEDENEFLLFAHLVAMYNKVEHVLQKNFRTTRLVFNEPEAVAFCMVWSKWNLDHDRYGKVVAHDLVSKIDKFRNNVKIKS
jgi:hypothetical protein